MPKILNLIIEEKAEHYSKFRKGAVHLTIEEGAVKRDGYIIIRSKYSMGYASRKKDKVEQIREQHYEKMRSSATSTRA